MKVQKTSLSLSGVAIAAMLLGQGGVQGESSGDKDLAQQVFETMLRLPGNAPGHRLVHAKGIVCKGTFAPSKDAAMLSKASHFQGQDVPVTVRFSDGAADPVVPDNSPDAGARGMAIRFALAGGGRVDIVANSHNGFIVSDGQEFLALQQAVVTTDLSKPHPWPIEAFLSARPLAMKFVQDIRVTPSSFATESFFGNDAFIYVNKDGAKKAGRVQIIPVAGQHDLSDAEAKAKAPGFLFDDIKGRLASGPVKFRLVIQLANEGDITKDPSVVWPADRKAVDVGTISVTSVVADSDVAEQALAFDPTHLTDGIELSDDPLPELRSEVYAMSVKHRRAK